MEIFLDSSVWTAGDFLSPSTLQQLELDLMKLVRFGRAPFQQRRRGAAWTVRKLERCLFMVLRYLAFLSQTAKISTASKSILGFQVETRCLQSTQKHLSRFLQYLRKEKKLNSQSLVYAFRALADYFYFVGAQADQFYPREPDENPVHLSSEYFDAREMGHTLPTQIYDYAEEQARQFGSLSIFQDYSKPNLDSSPGDDDDYTMSMGSGDSKNGKRKHAHRFDKLSTTEFAWLNSWQALLGAKVKAKLDVLKEENERWRLTQPLEKDLKFDWMDWTEAVHKNVWKLWKAKRKPKPGSFETAKEGVQIAALLIFTSIPQTRASVLCGLRFGTTLVERDINEKKQFVIEIDRLSEHASRHKMWPKYLEEGVQYLLKPCFLLEEDHQNWHDFMTDLKESNKKWLQTDLVFPSLQSATEKYEPFIRKTLKESFSQKLLRLLYGRDSNPLVKQPMSEQEMQENILQILQKEEKKFDPKFSTVRLFHFRKLAETALRQFALIGTKLSQELWEPSKAQKFITPKNAAAKTETQNKLSLHKNTDPYIDFRSTNPLNARVVDTLNGMCKRILHQRGWHGLTYDQIINYPFLSNENSSQESFWEKFLNLGKTFERYQEGPLSAKLYSKENGEDVRVKLAFWLNRTMSSDPGIPVDKFSIGLSEVLPKLSQLEEKEKKDWVLVLSSFRVQWTWLRAILKIQGYLEENKDFSENSPRIFVIVPKAQQRSVQRSILMQKYSRQIKIFFVSGYRWHANSFALFTPNFLRFSVCSAALRPAAWSLQTETIWMQDFKLGHGQTFDTLKQKWYNSAASTLIPDSEAPFALRDSLDLYSVNDSHCWYTGWQRRNVVARVPSKPLQLLQPTLQPPNNANPRVLCLQVSANSNNGGRFTDEQVTTAFGIEEKKENKKDEVRLYWPSTSQMHEATKFPGLALSAKQLRDLVRGADTGHMTQSLHVYKESAPSRKLFLPHCKLFAVFESEELKEPTNEEKKQKGLPCLAVLVGSYTLSTQSWCLEQLKTNAEMGHFVNTSVQKPLRAIYDFKNFQPTLRQDIDSTIYAPLHFTPFTQCYTNPQNMYVR